MSAEAPNNDSVTGQTLSEVGCILPGNYKCISEEKRDDCYYYTLENNEESDKKLFIKSCVKLDFVLKISSN
jgi:hypothetical protein